MREPKHRHRHKSQVTVITTIKMRRAPDLSRCSFGFESTCMPQKPERQQRRNQQQCKSEATPRPSHRRPTVNGPPSAPNLAQELVQTECIAVAQFLTCA